MSNQSDIQASVREATGTEYTYEGDWHALFDYLSIDSGTFNERLLLFLNNCLGVSYSNLQDAKNAFAIFNGLENWNQLGEFSVGALWPSGLCLTWPDGSSLKWPE